MSGIVSLVGAGPGDPELLTRRAWLRLRSAEVVYHDGLVPASIVRIARAADRVSVARRAGPKAITDAEVIQCLIESAREGRRTVRLKVGDPFVLGRGHDELEALVTAGIPCEVVPGVTSATAAPLLAGIPLTLRGTSSGFIVVSGHEPAACSPALSSLAPGSATVVVLMGMKQGAVIRDLLLAAGWSTSTPAAVITDASRPSQRLWTGRLEHLTADPSPHLKRPGVIVIGAVVGRAIQPAAGRRWSQEGRS